MNKLVFIFVIIMFLTACSKESSQNKNPEEINMDMTNENCKMYFEILNNPKIIEKNEKVKIELKIDNEKSKILNMQIKIEYNPNKLELECIKDSNYINYQNCNDFKLLNENNVILNKNIEKGGFTLIYSEDTPILKNGKLGEFFITVKEDSETEIKIDKLQISSTDDEGNIINYINYPVQNIIINEGR